VPCAHGSERNVGRGCSLPGSPHEKAEDVATLFSNLSRLTSAGDPANNTKWVLQSYPQIVIR
jgi:hypothetical protein